MGRYRKYDRDFKQGAVRLVSETGKPIAQVARELGVNEGTLGNWVAKERRERGEDTAALSEPERAELARLRAENTATPTTRWRRGRSWGGCPRVSTRWMPRRSPVRG